MTLLAVAVLNPASFSQTQYIARIITQLTQIPSFIGQIGYYLLFIIALEAILRFFDIAFTLLGINREEVVEEETAKVK